MLFICWNLGFLWEAQPPLLKWKLKLSFLHSKIWQSDSQKFKQQLKGTHALYLQDVNCYFLKGKHEFDSWFLNVCSFSSVSVFCGSGNCILIQCLTDSDSIDWVEIQKGYQFHVYPTLLSRAVANAEAFFMQENWMGQKSLWHQSCRLGF